MAGNHLDARSALRGNFLHGQGSINQGKRDEGMSAGIQRAYFPTRIAEHPVFDEKLLEHFGRAGKWASIRHREYKLVVALFC